MMQIVLEHLDEATFANLSALAKLNRLSLEEQAERILTEAVDMRVRRRRRVESADRIAAMTPKGVAQTDSVVLLREDRDQ
ncbi:MAG: hypothetical protein JO312_25905 [Hyphomicrobiales bacterium]|nr:hypothetical protein [Hyphomicrobiales bacterium]